MNRPSAQSLILLAALVSCGPTPIATGRALDKVRTCLDHKNHSVARTTLDGILATSPQHYEARVMLAELLVATDATAKAKELLLTLGQERARDSRVARSLAVLALKAKDYEAAVRSFERLPPNLRPREEWATALLGARRWEPAASALAELLVRDPWDAANLERFVANEAAREHHDSHRRWRRALDAAYPLGKELAAAEQLTASGQRAAAHLRKGRAYYRSGRLFDALQALREVLTASPKPAVEGPALLTIGRILTDVGRTAQAIQRIERALKLVPDRPKWRERLQQARTQQQARGPETQPAQMVAVHLAAANHDLARTVALFAAQRKRSTTADLELIPQAFDRPQDAFIRLWALRTLLRADPTRADLRAMAAKAATSLGITLARF